MLNHRQTFAEKDVAIVGVGRSAISRGAGKSALELTIDAVLDALACAGLKRSDIDGISSYPGGDGDASGSSPVSVPLLQDAMRLTPQWYSGGREVPGQFGAIINGIAAITAGLCRNILIYRTVYEATARKSSFANSLVKTGQRQAGPMVWHAPYHAYAPLTMQAPLFQRYIHESGIRPEQVAQIALNGRRNAQRNPAAIYRDPLSLDDYLASPMLSTPVRLLDCDVPVDGSCALIISRLDSAGDMRQTPLRFEAVGSALHYRHSWSQMEDLAGQTVSSSADMMWSRTDFKPADVDIAQLYDGFTYHVLAWLEGLGFCEKYGAGDFIDGGERIALTGALPLNTDGGALSAGRLHGYGYVYEMCMQLWGRAEGRQVRDPRIGVMSAGGGPLGGCLLVVRD